MQEGESSSRDVRGVTCCGVGSKHMTLIGTRENFASRCTGLVASLVSTVCPSLLSAEPQGWSSMSPTENACLLDALGAGVTV